MKLKKFDIDADGDTSLHFAAKSGNIRSITTYVTLGYDVNLKNNYGWTPLMTAVKYCQLKAIRTLVYLGADLTQRDAYGYCTLCLAASTGDLDIVQYLLRKRLKRGETLTAIQRPISPLTIAMLFGNLDIIQFLILENFKLDAPSDFEGITPMYIASVTGNVDVLNLLKRFGYNLPLKSVPKNDHEKVSRMTKIFVSPKRCLSVPKIHIDSSFVDSPLLPSTPIDFSLSPRPKIRKLDSMFEKTNDFIFDQHTKLGRSKSANVSPKHSTNNNLYQYRVEDEDDVFYKSSELLFPEWQKENRKFIKLLRNNSLDSYMTTFKDHEIDLDAFAILTENDLSEIGVKGTQRKRMLKLGYQLRRQGVGIELFN